MENSPTPIAVSPPVPSLGGINKSGNEDQTIPTFTTFPDAYYRHNISDEELTMLSAPSPTDHSASAMWASGGAALGLAPVSLYDAVAFFRDPTQPIGLIFLNIMCFVVSVTVLTCTYLHCRNKQSPREELAEKIRSRTPFRN